MSAGGDPEDNSLTVFVKDGLDNLFVNTPVIAGIGKPD